MKIVYKGLFLDDKSSMILRSYRPSLSKKVKDLHITFDIGKIEFFPEELMGKDFELTVIGYSESSTNKGFKVILPEILESQYRNKSVPHITTSMSFGASAKDTGKLPFMDIEPFKIKGRLGYFTTEGTIIFTNKGDL